MCPGNQEMTPFKEPIVKLASAVSSQIDHRHFLQL